MKDQMTAVRALLVKFGREYTDTPEGAVAVNGLGRVWYEADPTWPGLVLEHEPIDLEELEEMLEK